MDELYRNRYWKQVTFQVLVILYHLRKTAEYEMV